MIPGIKEILAMLLAGECDAQRAEAWINEHIELARERSDLRDMFATAAMQGMLAAGPSSPEHARRIPDLAYGFADQMLEASHA